MINKKTLTFLITLRLRHASVASAGAHPGVGANVQRADVPTVVRAVDLVTVVPAVVSAVAGHRLAEAVPVVTSGDN